MHNYKKVLPVAVALALAACGGDSSDTVPDQSVGGTQIGVYPRFDALTSDLPTNNDLIFAAAASSDGTANVGAPTNPATAAVNGLDGFSPTAYFDIPFAGGSIDPDSICGFGSCAQEPNVFLVPLDTGMNDALDPANIEGVDMAQLSMTSASVSAVSLNGGTDNTLRITPLVPLKSKAKYLVFVTDGLTDSSGNPVTASSGYHVAGGNAPDLTGTQLEPVRGAVKGWEQIAGGLLATLAGSPGDPAAAAAAKERVVVSYTFTTTDPVAPLLGMAAPRAALLQQGASSEQAGGLDMANFLSTPKPRDVALSAGTGTDLGVLSGGALASDVGNLYTGAITLPYYLSAPVTATDYSFLQKAWTADTFLGAQLGDGIPPADVDGTSYNVTYRYPFAAKTGDETVPLQVTLPDDSLSGCSAPYATVMYIHGITSDRSSVVSLAHTLASQCVATVAIDLPVHGVPANSPFSDLLNVEENSEFAVYDDDLHERHFNVTQGASGNPMPMNFTNPTALDGSGAWFINLADLDNTRDNLRQAVMDQLNLNASLPAISDAMGVAGLGSLDTNNVSVVGVSLGGIVGTVYAAVNQAALSADTAAGFTSNLSPLKGLVASVAGSQMTQVLNNSQTFAPVVQGGLAASNIFPNTDDYEKFLYVAQSAVASGDPVNFAGLLRQVGLPVLVQQINGDTVVPNGSPDAPLSGTEGLSELLGANQLGVSAAANVTGTPGVVKLVNGAHSSLLSPAAGAEQVTAELQMQVATFVVSSGAAVAVGGVAPLDIEEPIPAP